MKIMDWLRGPASAMHSPQEKQRIDDAIERIVQTTNPRLRFAQGYQKKLRPAVKTSIDYAHTLVASLPAARVASAAAWVADRFLRALFANPDALVQSLSHALELRAHFDQNPGLTEVYAVVGMEMSERKVLGMAMEGDIVRRDIAQINVNFGDYRATICGSTEAQLREELERRIVDQLALESLAQIVADDSRRTELKQESALLKARSAMLNSEGKGLRGALGIEPTGQAELLRLRAQMVENTRELAELGIGAELLDRQLEHIRNVMAEPDRHLYLSTRRLRLDAMNVIVDDPDIQTGFDLEFLVARLPGTVPPQDRAFVLVRFPRAELLPAQQLRDDAARWLI